MVQSFGMSTKTPNALDYIASKQQSAKDLRQNIKETTTQPNLTQIPVKTLNFGPQVSQKGVTNFQDFKQSLPTQPNLVNSNSGKEYDEVKIQQFIERGKELGKSREEIKIAYDKALQDGLFDMEETTQEVSTPEGEGLGAKLSKRVEDLGKGMSEIYQNPLGFAIDPLERTKQTINVAGPIAGAVNDTIGAGVQAIWNNVLQPAIEVDKKIIKAITPDIVENIAEQDWKVAKDVGTSIINSKVGQEGLKAISGGIEKYKSWAEKNPDDARLIDNTVNIAALIPIGKGGKVAKEAGEAISKTAGVVTSPIKPIIQQGKTLLGKPDEIRGIQQAIKPYVKIKDGKVIRSNNQIANEIKRTNELITQAGDIPTDLTSYREAIEKQLKGLGEQISAKTKQPLEVDLSETSGKLRELANKKTVGLLDKSESQKLIQLADDLEKSGKIGVSEAEYMNQFINDTLKNIPNVSETYKRGLNILVKDLRDKLDITLSTIPGEFKQIKKDYGALRNILGDTVKREIVYNRQNPEGLITGISKIEGLGNIGSGLLKIAGLDVKGGVSDIGKGLIQNRVGTFIKTKNDPNYIIQQIFSNKGKNVNNMNTNIPSTIKNNIGTSKNIGQDKQIKSPILSDREKGLIKSGGLKPKKD